MKCFKTVCLSLVLFSSLLSCKALAETEPSTQETTNVDDIVTFKSGKPNTKDPLKYDLSLPLESIDPAVKMPYTQGSSLTEEDKQNLTRLWRGILQKNVVIQYGLKQLATPPELRYAHQSVMSRSLGALLAGAGMIPYMFGADAFTAAGSTVGTNMVDKAVVQTKKIDPKLLPSDTELVALSGIVNALQNSLYQSYFQYKTSLITHVQLKQLLGKIEQQVASSQDPRDMLMASQLLDAAQLQNLDAKQICERNYLLLERMVGGEGMKTLRFDEAPLSVDEHQNPNTLSQQQEGTP